MELNLSNPIAERKTKTVYKDGDKTIKLFVEKYSKSDILNEALNQSRVEEGTNLNIPSLNAVTLVDNRWALVFDYVEGTTLEELMNREPEKQEEYLNKFIDIQLEVTSHSLPMLNSMRAKYKKRINSASNIDYNSKYELLQRLDGMKEHLRLCHGDFNPSNIVIKEDGSYWILDWAHVTAGNTSADAANTFLLFCLDGKEELANRYLDLFSEKSGIMKSYIQRWIPIVAAAEKSKGKIEEQDFLDKWIDVVDYN